MNFGKNLAEILIFGSIGLSSCMTPKSIIKNAEPYNKYNFSGEIDGNQIEFKVDSVNLNSFSYKNPIYNSRLIIKNDSQRITFLDGGSDNKFLKFKEARTNTKGFGVENHYKGKFIRQNKKKINNYLKEIIYRKRQN